MPGIYEGNKFDIAGFAVGLVDEDKILKNNKIKKNDLVLAVPYSGLHSNGYSLVRYILKKNKINLKKNNKLKKDLLEPTRIYVKEILELNNRGLINGCANITGGGLVDNISRIIPNDYTVEIDLSKIITTGIFKWIKRNNVSDNEMLNV